MKITHKTAACIILIILSLCTLTSCAPKKYGTFKVVQSKAVKGDYIILPDITLSDDNVISINTDKSYHFPLIMYKAIEKKLPDIASKFNDFSEGMTEAEAEKMYSLFTDDFGAGLITDDKQKSAYYGIITDLRTKEDAKNAEASAFLKEINTFNEMLNSVIEEYLDILCSLNDFVNKRDSYTEKQEDLFIEEAVFASEIMKIWFPSVNFISSFADKTGPDVQNPWIPDWEDLLSKLSELNSNYSSALVAADPDDPDEIDSIMKMADENYDELNDIWYELPSIADYEDKFETLLDNYIVINDKAYDMWEEAYDAAWDAYWNYNWW